MLDRSTIPPSQFEEESDFDPKKVIEKVGNEAFMDNIMLHTDTYKLTHWQMYKALNITHIYSYMEARTGSTEFTHTVFFGLQALLHKLARSVTQIPNLINFSEKFTTAHFSQEGLFNRPMWEAIADLGYLPIRIRAVREGAVLPTGNVMMTVENTDGPHKGYPPALFAPLVNHLESYLLHVWYPSTVATMSRSVRDAIVANIRELEEDGTAEFLVNVVAPYLLHDFGYRGTSSDESAGAGGLAHLLNFAGTDTVTGILVAMKDYYTNYMPGFSVPATEHSVMTSYGPEGGVGSSLTKQFLPPHLTGPEGTRINEDEVDVFINAIDTFLDGYASYEMNETNELVAIAGSGSKTDDLNEFSVIRKLMKNYPVGILSMVMDSYNIFVSVAYVCKNLKSVVKTRFVKGNALNIPVNKVVFRPDSQEPEEVLPILIKIIKKYFGTAEDLAPLTVSENSKGVSSIPLCLGLLWGDGMNPTSVVQLLQNAKEGWSKQGYTRVGRFSAANFILGMGGGLLQKVNRDTQRFAFKCSANKFDGSNEWKAVQKDPIVRVGEGGGVGGEHKTSKPGQLTLTYSVEFGNEYSTKSNASLADINNPANELKIVYEDGTMPSFTTLDNIHDLLKARADRSTIALRKDSAQRSLYAKLAAEAHAASSAAAAPASRHRLAPAANAVYAASVAPTNFSGGGHSRTQTRRRKNNRKRKSRQRK